MAKGSTGFRTSQLTKKSPVTVIRKGSKFDRAAQGIARDTSEPGDISVGDTLTGIHTMSSAEVDRERSKYAKGK